MRHARKICYALLAVLALTSSAHATGSSSCTAHISSAGPIASVAYDPFDGVARDVSFVVEFTNDSSNACTLSLAVKSQATGSSRYFKNGTDQLRYLVVWPDNSEFPNDLNQPRGSISLQGGVGKTKAVTLRVKVPANLIALAKTYNDLLTFRAYKAGTSTRVGTDRTNVATSAVVEARAQVNIAGALSSHFGTFGVDQIDFNTLTSGETQDSIVQVRATSGVSIAIVSQNLGRLRHKILLSDPGVLYTMRLDGTVINLNAPASINRSPPISLDGASYPMKLQIGHVTGRPAGNYQDMLTITVSPQ